MNVHELSRVIRSRVKDDYDAVIAITSLFEGMGKSTLAIQIGREITPNFDVVDRNVLFNPNMEEITQKIMTLPKYDVIDADEAIKVLYKLKRFDTMQIFLNQLYALAREKNLVTLLCMPRLWDFNEFFRNHKIHFHIHIVSRGHAVIFMKDWNFFAKDPWHLDENNKLVMKAQNKAKIFDYSHVEKSKIFSRCKGYIGEVEFDDLEEPLRTTYKVERAKHKYSDVILEGKNGERKVLLETVKQKILNDPESYCFKRNDKWGIKCATLALEFDITHRDALWLKDKIARELNDREKIRVLSGTSLINKKKQSKKIEKEPVVG